MKELKYIAVFGNALYILWIVYNAIDDGFSGIRTVEAVVLLGLIVLLSLDIYLLRKSK